MFVYLASLFPYVSLSFKKPKMFHIVSPSFVTVRSVVLNALQIAVVIVTLTCYQIKFLHFSNTLIKQSLIISYFLLSIVDRFHKTQL